VQARKVVVESEGGEIPVPMDEWGQVGIYAPAEKGKVLGKPLYLQKHCIRSTE